LVIIARSRAIITNRQAQK